MKALLSRAYMSIIDLISSIVLAINATFHIPMYSTITCLIIYFYLFIFYFKTWGRTILLLYLTNILLDTSPSEGGWDEDKTTFSILGFRLKLRGRLAWKLREVSRSWIGYKFLAKYFNMELVRTAELDQNKNYMFVYHPHGVMAMGANVALSTNGCDFTEKFPGIHRSGVTLNATFLAPFFHDWLLMIGFISANKSTLLKQLTTTTPFRKSVVLVPGGAAEALHAHPGIFCLKLKQRKGFIRVAIQTGCSVVPCLGFGENDMFNTVYDYQNGRSKSCDGSKTSWLFKFQSRLMKKLTFALPALTHVIPFRKKIAVVVGEPIHFSDHKCKPGTKPDEKLVDRFHETYTTELEKLYDRHKEKYGYETVSLEIL